MHLHYVNVEGIIYPVQVHPEFKVLAPYIEREFAGRKVQVSVPGNDIARSIAAWTVLDDEDAPHPRG